MGFGFMGKATTTPLLFQSKLLCFSLLYLFTSLFLALYTSLPQSKCLFRSSPFDPIQTPLSSYPSSYGKQKYAIPTHRSTCFSPVFFTDYWTVLKEIQDLCKNSSLVSPVLRRSMSMGVIHGGGPAFLRLKDYKEARANPTITVTAEKVLRYSLLKDHPDFLQLQSTVAKLEMTGREAEAVDILKKGYEQAQKRKKPHEAYEIDMLLVEMLIYKGDFKEALNRKCFKHEEISDARRPLYKAIIHIMLEDKDEQAKECWEEFTLIRENSHCHWQCQSSLEKDQPNNLISKFEEFKQLANLLKQDIQEVGQLISEFEEFKQLTNLLKKDIQEVSQLISEFEEFKKLANLLKKDIHEVGQLISEFEVFKQLANLLKKDIQEVGQRKQRNDRLININNEMID